MNSNIASLGIDGWHEGTSSKACTSPYYSFHF